MCAIVAWLYLLHHSILHSSSTCAIVSTDRLFKSHWLGIKLIELAFGSLKNAQLSDNCILMKIHSTQS